MAIGSRYVKGGRDDRGSARVLSSLVINFIARLILRSGVRDYTTGFVAAKKKIFRKIDFKPEGHGEYCMELIYKAKKAGLKIAEVPYIFKEREFGEPKTSQYVYSIFLYSIWYLTRILKIRMKY
jgi:dolichol-phosphate mannosyltransferase